MEKGEKKRKYIFLTDDDADDCLMFSEALEEILPADETQLIIANDGVKLMQALGESVPPAPELIFLDLNMPRKDGFECLSEIRSNFSFKDIPVVIFSTSSNNDIINRTYQLGANYYICKPKTYTLLKKSIHTVLSFDLDKLRKHPVREQFVIDVS